MCPLFRGSTVSRHLSLRLYEIYMIMPAFIVMQVAVKDVEIEKIAIVYCIMQSTTQWAGLTALIAWVEQLSAESAV